MNQPVTKIPVGVFAQLGLANFLVATGAIGIAVPEIVPALSSPRVAWSLLGVGMIVDAWAIFGLIGALRSHARGGK